MSETITVGSTVLRADYSASTGTVIEIYEDWYQSRPHARVRWHKGNPSSVRLDRLVLATEEAIARRDARSRQRRRKHLLEEIAKEERDIVRYRERGDEARARMREQVLSDRRASLATVEARIAELEKEGEVCPARGTVRDPFAGEPKG